MIDIFISIAAVLFFAIIVGVRFLWSKVSVSWLEKGSLLLIASLPFERIPSVEIAGANLRPSQLIVVILLAILGILFIKKDPELFSRKVHPIAYWALAFFAVSIPSWFMSVDGMRFWVTTVATVLAFAAGWLIANFTPDIHRALQWVTTSLFVAAWFAVYQFMGDLIGLPTSLTGLREKYTSIVFGFPRPHSTALEPLYFAGMMFLPVITFFVYWLAQKRLFSWIPENYGNLAGFGFFSAVLCLAYSKSAIVIIGVALVAIFLVWIFRNPQPKLFSTLAASSLGVTFMVFFGISNFPTLANNVEVISEHFIETITFQNSTASERILFLEAATTLLPHSIITGIGSGQFGVQAQPILRFLVNEDGGYFIVNNVYLEIWLEQGLLALLIFAGYYWWNVIQGLWIGICSPQWLSEKNLHIFILACTLGAYGLQWFTFSPIFIMPIFILLGLYSARLRL